MHGITCNTVSLIAAHRVACAIRDLAFAEIDKVEEDSEPQSLRDLASDITKAEGRVFAEMIGGTPPSTDEATALILYLLEVKQHPLGLWHIGEEQADELLVTLAESVRLEASGAVRTG
jgi:hypothetical protein